MFKRTLMRNILALVFSIVSLSAQAVDCDHDIIHFSVAFANAFENELLVELDDKYSFTEAILITVEHSLGGGEDELNGETGETSIKSFKELNDWLNSRRVEERPWPAMWPLTGCTKGVCHFGGKLSNQEHGFLFVKEIHYKAVNRKAIVTRIIFEDGD